MSLLRSPLQTLLFQNSLSKSSSVVIIFEKMLHTKGFINGEWVEAKSGKKFDVINPATEEVLASIPDMNTEDVDLAIQSAQKSFQSWRKTTAKERSILMKNLFNLMTSKKDEIAKVITLENGKTINESLGEVAYSADYMEFYAEEAKRIHGEVLQSSNKAKQLILTRQPIGVVGMLTPWNFPLAMLARKVAAAVASGCTCILKPAEDTPISALYLAAYAKEVGFPPGVINVITSSRENAPAVGQKLCTSPLIAGISFTGSTAVGKILYQQCSSTIKRLSLELGGNAPFIVFKSADLDKAIAGVMASKFRNSGQTCVSTNRIFVHESLLEEFITKLKDAMKSLVVGNGLDSKTNQGPLANKAQLNKVSSMVEDAVKKGAKIIVGGKAHSLGKTFYEPTLLTNLTKDMNCYKEEIFGPVAMVLSFKDEAEVIEMANDTRSGLAGYFYSNDIDQIWRVSRELEYGMIGINEGIISAAESAFGGIKESGFGREGSHHGIDEYTYIKYLCFGNLT